MFKPFFIHYFHHKKKWYTKRRGITFHIAPTTDPAMAAVYVAECSNNDNYCKRIGREVALNSTPLFIPLRRVPEFMEDVVATQCDPALSPDKFNYVYKHFL